jgi:hypothetical protein
MKMSLRSAILRTTAGYSLARLMGKRVSRPPGAIRLGALRSLHPVSVQFGYDRGLPVDRYYIEKFLALHAHDIQGRVLEIKDASYTKRFGGERVSASDVLSLSPDVGSPTIVGDLTDGKEIASASFDCVILTQTLQLIYDVRAALNTLQRILAPGGILLATMPGISQIARDEKGDFWRFTSSSCERLILEFFSKENVGVTAYGNVLTAISFLEGLSVQDLTKAELDFRDTDYELTVCVRAVKEALP